MATITSRKRKDGAKYTAQIRLKRNGKVVHTESETFGKKSLAKDWAARRESELKLPGALEQVRYEECRSSRYWSGIVMISMGSPSLGALNSATSTT